MYKIMQDCEEKLKSVEQWGRFEVELSGTRKGNPFVDVYVKGIFVFQNRKVTVRGFYDGEGVYKIRFMPDKIGTWSFYTSSNCEELDNKQGTFECINPSKDNHGIVHVSEVTHFVYADGKPYYPFGTTAYVWNYQTEELQKETLKTLKASPFNKIRMCVFPKYYDYNTKEPEMYPFEGRPKTVSSGKFDFSEWGVKRDDFDFKRFNPKFFTKLEQQIDSLNKLGIQADLILFHPYDRWGFAAMGEENDIRYLRYIVARLASFQNVWWSMANEYDLLELTGQKKRDAWDNLFKCVVEEDPYNHLLSVHNWHNPPIHSVDTSHWYNHHKSWISHASIQHDNLFFVPEWLETYHKPVVIDECRYEGNLNLGWGNLTAEKMVQKFWEGVCHGAYVTHGETYLNDDRVIWWSHGGKLVGESPKRIAFLKSILEDGEPKRLAPLGKESSHWEVSAGIMGDSYALIYFGDSQPKFKVLEILPEGVLYKADIIDTWNMTITKIEEIIDNKSVINLPGKPYMALRLTKI